MSAVSYSANLASDDIPLLSAFQGPTVIVGKVDQDYQLEINDQNKLQRTKHEPQAYYCHNVMPSGQGYQSVGFTQKISGLPDVIDFWDIFVLRDIDENKSLFSPAHGKNYIFDQNVGHWVSVNPIANADALLVTVAYLSGETYIFYEKVGCFKYNKATKTLDAVVLTSLIVGNIIGICASNGFLLAWDDQNTIYRSQLASPLDFTPDPSLGSGAGTPEEIRGKIVMLLPISNGFMVYTTENAVGAIFQQNIRYPFIFREVDGSSGGFVPEQVSWKDNLGEHYAWSKSGLQKLNKSKAAPAFPEITDFLIAKIFEDFDETTNTFNITKLSGLLNMKLTVVGSRFLVVSYGISSSLFTHAIIFDMAYRRFGKVKIDHIDCFNFSSPNLSGEVTWEMLGDLTWDDLGDTTWADFDSQVQTKETPKAIIAFLGNNGSVNIVNFDLIQTGNNGVVVFGKYQYVRERDIVLDTVEIENINEDANFELVHQVSINGNTTKWSNTATLVESDGQYRRYHTKHPYRTGKNHSLAMKGTFHVSNLKLGFHIDGRNKTT